ncbi:MAG: long-chain fatty acid--CoA ligase [Bryobacterales bacterium]|nr:long-chain fatty acid--CoA ligase [Bryobacterales bacterium]
MNDRTVYSLVVEAAEQYGDKPALYQPVKGQGWRPYSWLQYRRMVEEMAAGLADLGVQAGDIVALDAETRLEFYIADLGIQCCGAIAAALYTSYPPPEHIKTLRICSPRVVFVDSPKVLATLRSAADPPLDTTWILLTGEDGDTLTLAELRRRGRSALDADPDLIHALQRRYTAKDYAIVYLTSGATGEPKMGLVTHESVVANVDVGIQAAPVGPDDASIAFLPSAHITQRLAMQMFPLRAGMPVYFSDGLSRLPHELKSVKPTFLVAPPRVWERMHASIRTEILKKGTISRRIFYIALGLGAEAWKIRTRGETVPAWIEQALKLADKLVFSKIRERLGGRLRLAISGAAPLGKDLADFYAAIGMPIHEGYGLTEGGILALNPYGKTKSGSIGRPLPRVEVKVAEDGELIFRGPTLFSGYYRDPVATAAVLQDGWLHTGDVGEIDREGYVYITGRKKEVLVSSNGKKIYPALVEGLFKMEPLIHHILLVGDKQPYVTALFTINTSMAEALKGMDEWKGKPLDEISSAPPVITEVKRIVSRINKQLAPFEQIRKYHILNRDFTIEDGEITPTMKVRRARVIENHRRVIGELYLGRDTGE